MACYYVLHNPLESGSPLHSLHLSTPNQEYIIRTHWKNISLLRYHCVESNQDIGIHSVILYLHRAEIQRGALPKHQKTATPRYFICRHSRRNTPQHSPAATLHPLILLSAVRNVVFSPTPNRRLLDSEAVRLQEDQAYDSRFDCESDTHDKLRAKESTNSRSVAIPWPSSWTNPTQRVN